MNDKAKRVLKLRIICDSQFIFKSSQCLLLLFVKYFIRNNFISAVPDILILSVSETIEQYTKTL